MTKLIDKRDRNMVYSTIAGSGPLQPETEMKDSDLFYQVMSQIWDPAPDAQVGGIIIALVNYVQGGRGNSHNLFDVLQKLWGENYSLSVRTQDCEDNQAAYDLVFSDGSKLIAISVDGIGTRLETID